MTRALPPDDHVHSQFSYDRRPGASMRAACERALELGIPAVAFTEHLDFRDWGAADAGRGGGLRVERLPGWEPLDVDAYAAELAECRDRYPSLRIRSGVEAGEPHLFAGSLDRVLSGGSFERVLGSCHAVVHDGALVEVDTLYAVLPAADVLARYFAEVLRLVEADGPWQVLAHVDYARRYLPEGEDYREADHEEEYRAVFRALAASGRALEVNTKSPLASVQLVRWWRDCGGEAVSFGSDAHQPWLVGARFAEAAAVVEAAGFRPGPTAYDSWRR